MYNYRFNILNNLFSALIQSAVNPETFEWLKEKANLANEEEAFNQFKISFSLVARKIPKTGIEINKEDEEMLTNEIPGLSIAEWSIQKLCRAWMIMQIATNDRSLYLSKVEELFKDADMNELATLYASLPLLAYPEHWEKQCSEGIRSNIGNVLDAVIMDNPYPAHYLKEDAWNQLVLKALFTDKDLYRIIGWKERVNENLVSSLKDYADERKAANREINPKLWEIVELLEQNH